MSRVTNMPPEPTITKGNTTRRAFVLARCIITAVIVSAVLLTSAAAQQLTGTLKTIKDAGTITLGVRETSVPFSYLDNQHHNIGYGMDFAHLIVDALKKDLNLPNLTVNEIPVTAQTRLTLLANGTIDLECGSTSNSAERAKQVTFADNYFAIGIRMMVRKDSGIKDWGDLAGKTIVTTAGSSPELFVRKMNQAKKMNMNIVSAKEHSEAFLHLESGRAVAFVMDDILLYGERMKAKHPGDWIVVGTPLEKDAYACMLRKDDPQFDKFVNNVLTKAMRSGEAARIYKKWFQSPIPPKGLNLEFPMSQDLANFFKKPNNTPYQ